MVMGTTSAWWDESIRTVPSELNGLLSAVDVGAGAGQESQWMTSFVDASLDLEE